MCSWGYGYPGPKNNNQLHAVAKEKTGLIVSGWWYTYPSDKYEGGSWDDEIPNIWKVIIQLCSKPPIRTYS
jgi:hypothetical protein